VSALSLALLSWYDQHQRPLPWRARHDPYAIWVAEIMLQQTRVETVIPYYTRWLAQFPTLEALANADLNAVLSAWEGLGYYARARHLYQAAQIVQAAPYHGRLPTTAAELRRLPGIGPYTAGAIAAIAFGEDAPALDGNIRRVLARLFEMRLPLGTPAAERALEDLDRALLPPGRAGDFHQALMDLATAICTPRQPDCPACPLRADCAAFRLGTQAELPVRRPKRVTPHITVAAAVLRRADEVLLTQRPADGLLGSLWEFPGGKLEAGEDLPTCLRREIREELAAEIEVGAALGVYQHAYTHFRVTLHAFLCRLRPGPPPQPLQVQALRWVTLADLPNFPMGKIDRQIANHLRAETPLQGPTA
jgi:A/G-specific adenine glycosylase